jgi:hypothetical protein
MSADDERRELVPGIIATIVAAIGAFCVWSDLRNDSLGRGDGMITFAVVSRAGAIVAPSEPSVHLVPEADIPAGAAGVIEPLQTLVAEVEAMTECRTPEPFEPRHSIVQEKLPVFGPNAESQSGL